MAKSEYCSQPALTKVYNCLQHQLQQLGLSEVGMCWNPEIENRWPSTQLAKGSRNFSQKYRSVSVTEKRREPCKSKGVGGAGAQWAVQFSTVLGL